MYLATVNARDSMFSLAEHHQTAWYFLREQIYQRVAVVSDNDMHPDRLPTTEE
jgi:hypothetical protein